MNISKLDHSLELFEVVPYGPAVDFPGSSTNEVETTADNPISFASGEPFALALLILWQENPGTEGIFRSGSLSSGKWLVDDLLRQALGPASQRQQPPSSSSPLITAGGLL